MNTLRKCRKCEVEMKLTDFPVANRKINKYSMTITYRRNCQKCLSASRKVYQRNLYVAKYQKTKKPRVKKIEVEVKKTKPEVTITPVNEKIN